MEVRDVREASPVTMETMSSSWVTELCGNGGMLVLTGVRARDRDTCGGGSTVQRQATQTYRRLHTLPSHLIVVPHEGSPSVFGTQEAVDQHGPAQGEVEADVLLKIAAQLVTGQVVAEAEALARDQLVHLLSDWMWQQRLQTL